MEKLLTVHKIPTNEPPKLGDVGLSEHDHIDPFVFTKQVLKLHKINSSIRTPFAVYLTSGDKPKIGDWIINPHNEVKVLLESDSDVYVSSSRKIEVSGDSRIPIEDLPTISETFKVQYASWNFRIKYVTVEAVEHDTCIHFSGGESVLLKRGDIMLRRDRTAPISYLQQNYSLVEMVGLIKYINESGIRTDYDPHQILSMYLESCLGVDENHITKDE